MTFWKWSKTAASNGTADSTCPFPEGMAASAVNDGVRGAMAALAKWRDDISGALATSGSSTAYTVSSNQSFDTLAHMDNAMIAFVPHTTNGAAPTLAVDGLTAKKIRMQTGIDIPDGVLIEGTPYVVTYYATAGEFILHGLASQPYSVPLGGLLHSTVSTPPNSAFVLPYGQAISRTTYSTYFDKVGTTFGAGDGSTTFNVLDMRGRVIAGLDNMGGTAAGRITSAGSGIDGTTIGATGGSETHTLVEDELPEITPAGTIANTLTNNTNMVRGAGITSGDAGSGTYSTWYYQASGNSNNTSVGVTSVFNGTPFGGGEAHSIMPPSIVIPCFLRII